MKNFTIILACLMMLSKESLADTGEDLAKLEEFISRNPVGDEDYLLQMNSSYGWATVRRQSFWDQERPNLRECLAHLFGLIMRRAGGDASVALRVSSV